LLLVASVLAGCQRPVDVGVPPAGVSENRLVLLSPLNLARLRGEAVCVYNFSSW